MGLLRRRRRRKTLGDEFVLLPFYIIGWIIKGIFSLFLPSQSTNSSGYVVVGNEDGRDLYEHREVAKRVLGRSLEPGEVVHHINGKRADNRPENLCVMSDYHHKRYHGWYDWVVENYGKHPRRKTQLRKLREDFSGTLLVDVMKKSS